VGMPHQYQLSELFFAAAIASSAIARSRFLKIGRKHIAGTERTAEES